MNILILSTRTGSIESPVLIKLDNFKQKLYKIKTTHVVLSILDLQIVLIMYEVTVCYSAFIL